MSPPPGLPLAPHLIAIKADWRHRLRDEPYLSPLGRVDSVGVLMDATLMQVAIGLAAADPLHWLQRNAPLIGALHRHAACALSPILRYYVAGEEALWAILGDHDQAAADRTATLIRALGQHEVEALCGRCPSTGAPQCGLRPTGPAA